MAWTNYGRDELCLVGCLGSEPRLAQSQTRLLSRHLGEAAAPWGGGAAGRDPTLHSILWHLPRKTSVTVAERRSADQRRTRFF
jgi:hypothetical protein